MNVIAYAVNALETFGYGPFSSKFTPGMDNASISQKYQTIVTPHGISFSIWGVIFISQAICIASTVISDRFRTHPLMVEGVSSWYIAVCLTQTAWSPAFAHEQIPLSVRIMGFLLCALVAIVFRQYNVVTEIIDDGKEVSSSEYWLLQFPFEIHCSWITAALVLNMNILVVASGASAEAQAFMAAASLAVLATASFICLIILKRPKFVLPSVAAWATFWMSYELGNPKPLIKQTFNSKQIELMILLTRALCGILFAAILHGVIARRSAIAGMGISKPTDETKRD